MCRLRINRHTFDQSESSKLKKMILVPVMSNSILLYEYRDLFIDMAVRNNRSELATASRHQER